MTLLRVVTSPDSLSALIDALMQIGITGMTIADARCSSAQRRAMSYRGDEYAVSFIPRIEVQIAVDDEQSSDAINEILEVARHVLTEENRVNVLPIEAAYHIRTGIADYRREAQPA